MSDGEEGSREPSAELWYRYEDRAYTAYYVSEFGDDCDLPSIIKINLRTFTVVKTTPKGVWLNTYPPRFVLRSSFKRFACPTLVEAKESFIARKNKQIVIHKHAVYRAKKALALINGDTFGGL